MVCTSLGMLQNQQKCLLDYFKIESFGSLSLNYFVFELDCLCVLDKKILR